MIWEAKFRSTNDANGVNCECYSLAGILFISFSVYHSLDPFQLVNLLVFFRFHFRSSVMIFFVFTTVSLHFNNKCIVNGFFFWANLFFPCQPNLPDIQQRNYRH